MGTRKGKADAAPTIAEVLADVAQGMVTLNESILSMRETLTGIQEQGQGQVSKSTKLASPAGVHGNFPALAAACSDRARKRIASIARRGGEKGLQAYVDGEAWEDPETGQVKQFAGCMGGKRFPDMPHSPAYTLATTLINASKREKVSPAELLG